MTETIEPACVVGMGCMCAGHARGNAIDAPCDTSEAAPEDDVIDEPWPPDDRPAPSPPKKEMNIHERSAWGRLERMGAARVILGSMSALDLRPVRIKSAARMAQFCQAFHEVAGRSGANRRHVDRNGCPVFVVTEDPRFQHEAP